MGEVVDRISLALAAHEQRHDRAVDDELAGPDPPHGVDQLPGMADAVLEEVADAAGRAGHQLDRVVHLEVLGEQEHAGTGPAGADLALGFDALQREVRRHADVDDGDVGLLGLDLAQQPGDIAGFAHHVEPGVPEHGADALADEDAVVGYDDAHGSSARTFVPAPGRLSTENEPPTAATRSASPVRPVPAAGEAPPSPSSAISRTR